MQYVKLPRGNKSMREIQVISQDDFNRILKRFPQGSSFYVPINIAYHTGIRISECCALTWDDIDLKRKIISINKILIKKYNNKWHFSEPKTVFSTREILIGDTLVKILKEHKNYQKSNKLKYGELYKQQYQTEENRIYEIDLAPTLKSRDKKIDLVCTSQNGSMITSE